MGGERWLRGEREEGVGGWGGLGGSQPSPGPPTPATRPASPRVVVRNGGSEEKVGTVSEWVGGGGRGEREGWKGEGRRGAMAGGGVSTGSRAAGAYTRTGSRRSATCA